MLAQIDKVYVINLAHRVDRRLQLERQMEFLPSLKNRLQIVTAVDGNQIQNHSKLNNGELGCAMSHIGIWKDALANKYNTILVFEDDVILDEKFEEKLSNLLAEIRSNFDWLYLYNTWDYRPVEPFSDAFVKVIASLGMQAYIIRTDAISRLMPFAEEFEFAIDVVMGHMSFLSKVYRPKIVFVRHDENSKSSIRQNISTKSKIIKMKNKLGIK